MPFAANENRFDSNQPLDLAAVLALVSPEMERVDHCIKQNLNSDIGLINQIGHYIVAGGGKRLRPLSLLLCAHALESDISDIQLQHAVELGAVIECIHTATLLHDDVVDESDMRRGRSTANASFGNAASVLVGDYLYSRAFEMMVAINEMRVMQLLATTTNQIAEGEVMQLLNCGSVSVDEALYQQTIERKTAILFEAATRLAAIVCNKPAGIEDELGAYGKHLGVAFQLVDDVLDYTAASEQLGKNVGDDLAEGKPTLPLIHALGNCHGEDHDILVDAIENANIDQLPRIVKIIQSSGSIDYTKDAAAKHVLLAKSQLANLSDSTYKEALLSLADFAISRSF